MSHLRLGITAVEEAPESAPFVLRGPFRDSIRTAGLIGYDAIELHVADPSLLDKDAIGEELEKAGVQLSTLGTGLSYAREGISLTSSSADVRRMAVARVRSHIHFARAFGSSVIIGLIRGKIAECGSPKSYFTALEDSLRECLETAEANGVVLVLESVNRLESDALTNTAETLSFMDKFQSGFLLLHLDTYHMDLASESWPVALALAGKRLGHVHVADRNRLCPGTAGIDFVEVIRQIDAIGYKGCLALVCQPVPTPYQAAQESLGYFQRITRRTV